MTGQQQGFSLIEALVSVLVLSIGLLGLGQFQAGLWKSAAQLYAASEAYLISTSSLERELHADRTPPATGTGHSYDSASRYTVFDSTLARKQRGRLTEVNVSSRWQDTAGENRIRLQTAIYRTTTGDSRWLLDLN
jgi:prepilin-type N-terminal cleavage/methylation domain-containing protein